jgi:hypothetical protein
MTDERNACSSFASGAPQEHGPSQIVHGLFNRASKVARTPETTTLGDPADSQVLLTAPPSAKASGGYATPGGHMSHSRKTRYGNGRPTS